MKNIAAAIGGGLLVVTSLALTPLMVAAACQDTRTPISAPAAFASTSVDGFGQLNTDAIPHAEWVPWLDKAGALCPEIPAALLAAQIEQESSWNQNAQSQTVPGLHTGGAQGLAQFMPATWAEIGKDDDGNGTASPFDPGDAIMAQGRYMCQLVTTIKTDAALAGGDVVSLALAGYNAGPDAVKKYGGIPPFKETQDYVPQIAQLAITKYSLSGTAGSPAAGSGGTPVQVGPAGPINAAILSAALPWEGLPYVWSGGELDGPSGTDPYDGRGPGFDCSGLVRYAVYQGTGGQVTLPRVSRDQGKPGPHVIEIPENQAQPGDIIAFKFGDTNGSGPEDWTHIGLISAPGQMFNAPESGSNLGYADLTRPFYANAPHKIYRVQL